MLVHDRRWSIEMMLSGARDTFSIPIIKTEDAVGFRKHVSPLEVIVRNPIGIAQL